MEGIERNLTLVLTRLLQMSAGQRSGWVLATLLFALLLGMVSDALIDLLNLPPWVTVLLLLALIAGVLIWNSLQETAQPRSARHRTGKPPTPHAGLVLCLSLFDSRPDKQRRGIDDMHWRYDELAAALSRPQPDWLTIIERFEHSNMQPALEAIRHHSRQDTLRHVWLITTAHLETALGEVVQHGSRRLAPLFERIVREGIGFRVTVHYQDPGLEVSPYEVGDAYQAVKHVYTVAAPQVGLQPHQVIADLTGGRVPTNSGMMLACAPCGWPMQYTTTGRDPAKAGPDETPTPLTIVVDVSEIQRCALEAVARELAGRQ